MAQTRLGDQNWGRGKLWYCEGGMSFLQRGQGEREKVREKATHSVCTGH